VFEVKTNFSALEMFRDKLPTLVPKLVAEVSRQTLYFVSDIQRNQMSGRRGEIYLNVGTGHLRRSWFAQTRIDGEGIYTRAFTNVPYARIHQKGGVIRRSKFVSPSGSGGINIPKRLFIEEEFTRQMPARYEKAVLKVMTQEFKNG
jgi:phage gpG-like protein